MKNRCRSIALILALCFALLSTTASVQANSVPSVPAEVIITFFSSTQSSPEIIGVKFLGCSTADCSESAILLAFRMCNNEICLLDFPNPPNSSLTCMKNQCKLSISYHDIGICKMTGECFGTLSYAKLIVNTSSGVQVTKSVDFPNRFGSVEYWAVDLSRSNPDITVDKSELLMSEKSVSVLLLTFAFSLIVELVVTGIFLLVWKKRFPISIREFTLKVILANNLSFPLAWLVIPSFRPMEYSSTRNTGMGLLIILVMVTFFTIVIFSRSDWVKEKWFFTVIILMPLFGIITYGVISVSNTPSNTVILTGLSYMEQVVLAEILVFLFEVFFIFSLKKREVSLKQTALMVFTMNAASYLLGLLIL